ncbi:MAG TPA: carboxylate--amine ligase/circularly permuted type 2 ATP-grasp protein [Polyangia bacterium]
MGAAASDDAAARSPSSRLTLGVEEEFHLVDLRSRRLTPRAAEVLAALADAKGTFTTELQQTTVETNTEVTDTLEGLRGQLVGLRSELASACERLGVGAAAAGTMPLSTPLILTENPRFRRMLADYQLLVREQLICGMQVHVGIGNPDTAAALIDRVSPWLPPLLALSASSPFAQGGQDTGYASSRSLIWSRWPTTGSAGAFATAAAYDEQVQSLIASGVISDRGMIYFDVRPSAHVPTIELRICDACPAVDTVVLIAALFRAVVARELSRLDRGEPSNAVAPALHRAAMWRAARSGLEGELVDLSAPRAVPAGVLVRGMLNELRPELERDGDWQVVAGLCEEALSRGSAAARQREVLRRRQSIKDVVDLIVAETAGRTDARLSASLESPLIPDYHPPGFDEAVLPDGRPRPSHATVLERLVPLPNDELRARQAALTAAQREAGVVFRTTGQKNATTFPIDFVPRVLTGEDWSRLQGGTAQRARALDAFVADVYGPGEIFRDGVLPSWVVTDAPGYRAAGTAPGPKQRRIHVAGFDMVRDHEGRWLVLEDNVRVPSGVAFAMFNRRLMRQAVPDLFAGVDLHDPETAPALLRRTLEESAPPARSGDVPRLALLTAGPADSAYFEHRILAEAMGIPLVQSTDLLVEDDTVHHVDKDKRRTPIDVIYLRTDELLAKSAGADGRPLGGKLIQAVRAGKLTLANAIGNGVADDKAIYDHVPKLIKYYLGEHPLLEQVRTYHCADPDERAEVLARLDQLVVKPVDGYGGFGVTIGPQVSDQELDQARALIEEQPARWIAQEVVALSTHPTFGTRGGRSGFFPAHIDLRVFVYYGDSPVVVPSALTRVAPFGSMIVNSSRGGGAKDTWILR